jgi:hypothetical protein
VLNLAHPLVIVRIFVIAVAITAVVATILGLALMGIFLWIVAVTTALVAW